MAAIKDEKKIDRRQTDKNVNLVDDRNYFINFLIFTAPPLGGVVKAVLLPHLPFTKS